ncbi:MAG TPA: metal ABC transporter permease [Candidatus Deferrimicrobium sp.]|nr:metal ABC transporter permease [Candidatus Deferrimicrobium sp.]
MTDFLEAVQKYRFLSHALLAGVLASVACGVVGTYVVTRRISYIAGAISHSVLGGMGIAYYLSRKHHLQFIHPIFGAIAAALLSAVLIGWVSLRGKQREDTVIGAIWAIGMALGIICISATPGYNEDLMSYLFGNILLVSTAELWLIGGLDLLVLTAVFFFYNQFLAVCFDEEFARLRGIRVEFYYLLLLCLVALTVVILVSVVGIVMVIALLTLPAAVAGHFTRTLRQMMTLATVCCAVFCALGLALSFSPELPAGAMIIVVAGAAYLVVAFLPRLFKRQSS